MGGRGWRGGEEIVVVDRKASEMHKLGPGQRVAGSRVDQTRAYNLIPRYSPVAT